MNRQVERVKAAELNESDELRALLASCFPRSSEIFARRGYLHEPPEQRFILLDDAGDLIAHAAVRARPARSSGGWISIAGISEVCVRSDYRDRGLAKKTLQAAHRYSTEIGFSVSLLFGQPEIYASSGYTPVENVFRYWDPNRFSWVHERIPSALVRPASGDLWPDGLIDLCGVLY